MFSAKMNQQFEIRPVFFLICLTLSLQAFAAKNVLLIMIDDFNDWSGYLKGHPQARTPNLDSLAKKSVYFEKAYANSPSCNPSRVAMLSGKHPHSTGVYSNQDENFRDVFPNAVTLPQYFNKHGYSTFRAGKIFHFSGDWATTGAKVDLSFETNTWGNDKTTEMLKDAKGNPIFRSGINWGTYGYIDWGALENPQSDFGEYGRAQAIINEINKPGRSKPFFMGLGFYLPHLPWYFPKSVLDEPALAHIKNIADVQLPELPPNGNDQNDMGKIGITLAGSADSHPLDAAGNQYKSWHEAITINGKWKEAVQAYLASIYFMDKQLGRVLKTLEASPYRDSTIIVLVGDHGWMLGEKSAWSKYKPWEESVRTHFLINAPGLSPAAIDKPISLIDLFPTTIALAGLPEKLDSKGKPDYDGRNLLPLLRNPSREWNYPVVTAHGDWNGGWQSVRNQRYRYIRFMKTGVVLEEELYDHDTDPNEWVNLAGNSALASIKQQLKALTQDTWTPPGSWISNPAVTSIVQGHDSEKFPGKMNIMLVGKNRIKVSGISGQGTKLTIHNPLGTVVADLSNGLKSGTNNLALPNLMEAGGLFFLHLEEKGSSVTLKIVF
jgi:arylsulfatase A-like enzyme